MKKHALLFGVVLLSGVVLAGCKSKVEPTTPAEMEEVKENTVPATDEANSPAESSNMNDEQGQVFTVTADDYSYDIKEIKVKKDEPVTIKFVNSEGFHDFIVDEFNVKTQQIKAGEEETVTFTPDTAGSFEYYCSVGQHRKMGMVGKLIVED